MNLTKEILPGGYVVETYCDDCANEIIRGQRNYRIGSNTRCKDCGKDICYECRFEIRGRDILRASGYFDVWCLRCTMRQTREEAD